jgi:hypothetical protein
VNPLWLLFSAPDKTRWGFTEFMEYSTMPDGRIPLIYADAADASETHGEPAPSFSSADSGLTWSPLKDDLVPAHQHFFITPVYNGEFLVVPSIHYFDA